MHKMKLCLDRPLVVEGKYDKNTISQVVEGVPGHDPLFYRCDAAYAIDRQV